MRMIGIATAAAALALAGAQSAAAKPDKQDNGANQLRNTLVTMVNQHSHPPGQSKRPDDPDMGDDNAAARAIFVVCVRNDTPAAQRSAICDGEPITPH